MRDISKRLGLVIERRRETIFLERHLSEVILRLRKEPLIETNDECFVEPTSAFLARLFSETRLRRGRNSPTEPGWGRACRRHARAAGADASLLGDLAVHDEDARTSDPSTPRKRRFGADSKKFRCRRAKAKTVRPVITTSREFGVVKPLRS